MDYSSYYDKDYFIGGTKSNYQEYKDIPESLGRALDIIARNPDAKTILDVGCAYGHTVKHLREMGYDAYGCDVSEWAISRSVAPKYTVVASITKLPLFPGLAQYDLIVSTDVLEHVDPADLPGVITELQRVGKKQDHAVSTWPGKTPEEHLSVHPIEWWEEQLPGCHLSDYELYRKLGQGGYAS